MKPILFNTEMVRAILDGYKTVTRRAVAPRHLDVLNSPYHLEHPETPDRVLLEKLCEPPCRPGDVLWVRETWYYESHMEDLTVGEPDLPSGRYLHRYVYKADNLGYPVDVGVGATGWRPSIHMPREAARIWLRVTDVRVERLREIENIAAEGITMIPADNDRDPRFYFIRLWDSTIKPADRARYGWEANPWVWVIKFERCEKPE